MESMLSINSICAPACSVSGRWEEHALARPCHAPPPRVSSSRRRYACGSSSEVDSGHSQRRLERWRACGEQRHPKLDSWQMTIFGCTLPPIVVRRRRNSTFSYVPWTARGLVSLAGLCPAEVLDCRSSGRQSTITRASRGGSNSGTGEESWWMKEEQRWMKEEQRWVREEQRWLREEQRWEKERARWAAANLDLHQQLAVLKRELEDLRGQKDQITDNSLKNLVAGMRNLLQAVAAPGVQAGPEAFRQIPDFVSSVNGLSPGPAAAEPELDKTVLPVSPTEIIAVVTPAKDAVTPAKDVLKPPATSLDSSSSPVVRRRTLKSGMEGDDVKEMQDALAALGYYSGEEDMEDSVFASGTLSAVKSWQATRGAAENGIVTEEQIAALLNEVSAKFITKKGVEMTKAPISASKPLAKVATADTKQQGPSDGGSREIDRYERTNAQETGSGSLRRVYLLGENRWEEPDRLTKMQNGASVGLKVATCFACRGVATVLCTDCEGTGDLNVEEQFLEWTDDGAKCPYCEGAGAVVCDVCNGKTVLAKG